jgi:hypothetical protein
MLLKDTSINELTIQIFLSCPIGGTNESLYVSRSYHDGSLVGKHYLNFIYPILFSELKFPIYLSSNISIPVSDRYFPADRIKDIFNKFWTSSKEEIINICQVTENFLVTLHKKEATMTQEEADYNFRKNTIVCNITGEGALIPYSVVYLRIEGIETLYLPVNGNGKIGKQTLETMIRPKPEI